MKKYKMMKTGDEFGRFVEGLQFEIWQEKKNKMSMGDITNITIPILRKEKKNIIASATRKKRKRRR